MIVGARTRRCRTGVVLLALTAMFVSCVGDAAPVGDPGGDGSASGPSVASGTAASGESGAVPASAASWAPDPLTELGFLGSLPKSRGPAVAVEVDGSPSTLPVASDASLEIPAGAFTTPTEISAEVLDLDFGEDGDVARGAVYVLATRDEVDLETPITLEIDLPTEGASAAQLADGQWDPVDIEPGNTVRVSITGFSTVPTVVFKRFGDPPEPESPAADVAAPSTQLKACFTFQRDLIVGPPVELPNSSLLPADFEEALERYDAYRADLEAWTGFILKHCVRALVEVLAPAGDRVELECVDARVDELGLQGAIDSCAGDQTVDELPGSDAEGDSRTEEGDGQGPASSSPVLNVTSYALVSTGSPTGGDETILDGSLQVEVSGDLLRFTGQLTWEDPLRGTTMEGVSCWGTDTFAFAGDAPFTHELLVPLTFTESLEATLNGDCGVLTFDHRIPDHLDNEENLWLQVSVSDGSLVGGDYDGALVLEPNG